MFSFNAGVCADRVAMPLTNNRSQCVNVRLTNNRSRYVIVRLTYFRTALSTFPLRRIQLLVTPCSAIARIWQHLRLTNHPLCE